MERDFSLPPVVVVRDSHEDDEEDERRQHPSLPYQRGYGHGRGFAWRPGRHIQVQWTGLFFPAFSQDYGW